MRSQFKNRLIILLVSLSMLVSACSADDTTSLVADYGSYGAEWAESFAAEVPFRSPYSQGELQAAQLIEEELDKLGYDYKIQEFSDPANASNMSKNIVVRIEGSGFRADPENPDPMAFLNNDPALDSTYVPGINTQETEVGETTTARTPAASTAEVSTFPGGVIRREIIYGAHYDTLASTANRADMPDFDGINDNASGVAALLTVLKELKNYTSPFDITVVFFGARYAGFQGSLQYATSIADEVENIEGVYIVDAIYAGEKLYGHSGRNSLIPDHKYLMRRKLYETTDIVLQSDLYQELGVGVYTNQAGFQVTVPGYGEGHIYREFTLNEGDYLPFDSIDIPTVFFQGGNYAGEKIEDIKESSLPAFIGTNGQISNTNSDNSAYLETVLPEGELERRINAVAYILLTVTQKGVVGLKAA